MFGTSMLCFFFRVLHLRVNEAQGGSPVTRLTVCSILSRPSIEYDRSLVSSTASIERCMGACLDEPVTKPVTGKSSCSGTLPGADGAASKRVRAPLGPYCMQLEL